MLATIALTLCATVLFKMKREKYAWVAIGPTLFLLCCTLTAGLEKIFHSDPRVGFLALANKYKASLDSGAILAPAKSLNEMKALVFNNQLNAGLTALFIFVMLCVLFFAIRTALKALKSKEPTAHEVPYEPFPANVISGKH